MPPLRVLLALEPQAARNTTSTPLTCCVVQPGMTLDKIPFALRRKSSPTFTFRCRRYQGLWVWCDCDLVAELAKRSREHPGALLLGLGMRFAALIDKSHPLMQDLPNQAAEPMDDGPDGGLIASRGSRRRNTAVKVTAVLNGHFGIHKSLILGSAGGKGLLPAAFVKRSSSSVL